MDLDSTSLTCINKCIYAKINSQAKQSSKIRAVIVHENGKQKKINRPSHWMAS